MLVVKGNGMIVTSENFESIPIRNMYIHTAFNQNRPVFILILNIQTDYSS